MLIRYFLNCHEFATRTRDHIPRKGEWVRFNNKYYKVVSVIYIEDEFRPYVIIHIEKNNEF